MSNWDGIERRAQSPNDISIQMDDIRARLNRLESKFEFINMQNQGILKQISEDVSQMNAYLNGQGPELPGLKILVDRHDQQLRLFGWMFGVVITVGAGLLMTQIWSLVLKS